MVIFEFEIEDFIKNMDASNDGLIQKPEMLRFITFLYGKRLKEVEVAIEENDIEVKNH